MRGIFCSFLWTFLLLSTVSWSSVSDTAQPITNVVIYTAKKIITMEPSLPEASAVSVADGRIVAVGSLDSMAYWSKQKTTTSSCRSPQRSIHSQETSGMEALQHPAIRCNCILRPRTNPGLSPCQRPRQWKGSPQVPQNHIWCTNLRRPSRSDGKAPKILLRCSRKDE